MTKLEKKSKFDKEKTPLGIDMSYSNIKHKRDKMEVKWVPNIKFKILNTEMQLWQNDAC